MAITLAGLQLIASLHDRGLLTRRRSVMEIGSQDLHPKQDEVARLLTRLAGARRDLDTFITPEVMYKILGFAVYKCIDADGRHNALMYDLNHDLREEYHFAEEFDLVTNHGTTEHVFDQCRAFQNIHHLCAPGGIMLHEVPFQRWINHGLYNYQPTLFYDLSSANHYDLVGLYIGMPAVGDIIPYSDALAKALCKTELDMELLVALRKTRPEPFRNPYNGKYLETCLLKEDYETQYQSTGVYEQFFPGPRTPRADPTTDLNRAPTRAIARALFRRLLKKVSVAS
jgi:SAM-dependent methyltransferase